MQTLVPLDRLLVRTQNSLYEIIVRDAREGLVLVRGGRFFQAFTETRLAGSSFGGSFLKLLGIYVGLRMELLANGERIITSPIAAIAVCPFPPAAPSTHTSSASRGFALSDGATLQR